MGPFVGWDGTGWAYSGRLPGGGGREGCWNRGSSSALEGLAGGVRLGQGKVGRREAGFLPLSPGALSRNRLQGQLTVWFPPTHPAPTLDRHTLPQPQARPGALGFPQPHSCLHSSCRCDSQAGAGSHAVCGHALGLGARAVGGIPLPT